jgi:hypothetical protein
VELEDDDEWYGDSMSAYTARGEADDKWYVDSGATQHLTSRKEWLEDYKKIPPRNVYLADNRQGDGHRSHQVQGQRGREEWHPSRGPICSRSSRQSPLEPDQTLYRFAATVQVCDTARFTKVPRTSMAFWHQQLGHLGVNGIRRLETKRLVTGLDLNEENDMGL